MDAYILGRHAGELPSLTSGSTGNRVRAMARLDGPEHDVFYALEVNGPDGVDVVTESLTDLGLVVSKTHLPARDDKDKYAIVAGRPSHMPPWEVYLFLNGDVSEEIAATLNEVVEDLGEGTVAAAVDNNGDALIELGSNDEAKVLAAGATVANVLGGNVTTHAVVGGGIITG